MLVPADEVTAAMTNPTTTRAYFRGSRLAKWPDDIVAGELIPWCSTSVAIRCGGGADMEMPRGPRHMW